MKKYILLLLLIALLSLIACNDTNNLEDYSDKEGIYPYELSESEKNILRSFGMSNNSHIVSFNAPMEAITFYVNVYSLDSSNSWNLIGGSGTSIGKERIPVDQLTGKFSMILKDNNAIDCFIDCGGVSNFQVDEIILKDEILASKIRFLNEFRDIELNKEIPIALMIYSSNNYMYTYSLEDFYEPERLGDLDLVQVITMSFTDDEL